MKYNLLFLDIDGTLKQEPHGISDINKEAILKACRIGKKITIASGRSKDMLIPTIKELKLDEFTEAYTIALNGAHIIENHSGQTLHTVPLPMDLTTLLFEKAFELKISCHIYTENFAYFNYEDAQFKWYQDRGCRCDLVDMNRSDLGFEELALKFFAFSLEADKLMVFKEEMADITSGILSAEFSSKYSLEYTSVKASKGIGMEYICNKLGVPMSETIAAGDGENDISMIKKAGLGVAMKNALDSVKSIADIITKKTCLENGVTEIIEEYLMP
ncbi:MAG: Cof-type HAD-IIB family hydrolase [Clostridiales bacterium]|nr:Cof-type HAD-IIB family hydrolase [Clostridiales bacterium]